MTSKREIRALKRENFRLKEENSTLINKNRVLNSDNCYFAKFVGLIVDVVNETEPLQRNFKLFH